MRQKTVIEDFLRERGLALSPEKTKIAHIEEGFDFLGWNVRKYDGVLLIKPSKKNVQAFMRKIRAVIKGSPTAKQETLIATLNPIIRGWANYHQNQVGKDYLPQGGPPHLGTALEMGVPETPEQIPEMGETTLLHPRRGSGLDLQHDRQEKRARRRGST